MRDEKGKSVSVLQEFQAETMMAPFTPEKPLVTGKMPIYQNGEALSTLDFMTEREDYLSRFTQHNQGEMPVHCDAGFAGEPYEAQGWTPLYTNPTRLPESTSSTNPLAEWTYLSFSDLLALNHGLAAPMCGDQTSYDFSSYMDFQSPLIAPMPENLGSNLRTEILQKNAVTNGSRPVTIPNAFSDGIIPVFAPETPDQSKRLQDNSASKETICSAYKHPDNQNGEDSQMSVIDDLMGVKGTQSATDSTVLDSYDPDKGGNSDLDQNKTSQQKPRRKKHRPKVIKADKPKQTPKERKSTPTDANETPRQKRKYVRKNKTVLPSTTPPESGAEALDSTIPDPAVKKSCRKALNFELEDQEKEKKEIDTNETPRQKRKYVPKKKADTTSTESGTEALEYKIPDPDLKTCRKDLNFDLEDQEKEKKQIDANETPRQKRKYVRKKKANTTSPESGTEALEYKIPDPALKTCRKDLNFDLEDQETENNFSHRFTYPPISEQITENLYPRKGKDVITEALQEIGAEAQSTPHPDQVKSSNHEFNVSTEHGSGRERDNFLTIGLQKGNRTEAIHPREIFAHGPNYSTCASFSEGEHMKGLKRANCCSSYTSDMLLGNANCCCAQGMYFPEIHSKRKAVKALKPNLEDIRTPTSSQNYPREAATTSKYFYSILAPHFNVRAEANSQSSSVPNHQAKTQFIYWGDLNKLKRSKNSTHVRDLDTMKGFEECNKTSKSPGKERAKHKQKKNVKTLSTSCKEARPGEHNSKQEGRRKNGKKKSATTSLNAVNKHSPYLYYDQHFTGNAKGPFLALPWINSDSVSVDAIIEGMKQLNINREGPGVRLLEQNTHIPYYVQNQQTNALVLYQRDGVIIPFEGTQPSKRRPRAKVELDDETNRVWNLLLEDINNQGIDGTDEQKTKWWKEEREVFHGRVDSFIARMRLVQGDRRFSPWKGSVLDSVVGVFLTQNVSDHLSSSAYMSLAARYPLKSADKARRDPEEEISPSIREPEICIVDLDDSSDTLALNEKTVYTVEGPICDGNSSTLLDVDIGEEKVVNSEESHGITNPEDNKLCLTHSSQGEPRESQNYRASNIKESEIASILLEDGAMDDGSSSQQSLISSQNSDESPSVPTSGKMGLSSDDSSEVKDLAKSFSPSSLHCSTTFVELLRMAETSLVHATNVPKEQVPSYQIHLADQEETVVYENPSQKASRSEMMDSFSNVHVEEEYILHGDEEIKTTTEASNTTAESAEEFHLQKEASETNLGPSSPVDNAGSCYVLEGENMIFRSLRHPLGAQQETINPLTEGSLSPQRNIKSPAISGENGVTESTCASSSTICDELTPPLPLSDHNHGSCEASKQDTVKQRTGKTPNRASYDWDSLRKQAQANGSGTRQRATNTMDSIDWEAVRFADVNEIADTIKERGMNNKLAERIKECLDRLVNDHGSIDLEWLRDVPPDKAKEYLLSIRGLGLKSVECVRLLTLHHLAFPVDTNVGRIAVRLGWVPLQPLPESLQLHLLELYPILESIQKYLWPRLCKLDQRTLYELHYHLITFGKVFCTKRQPNCNACPLRGECRHFASAFASARLALPGPQDKSIVLSDQSKPSHQDPQAITNTLPMPLPMPGQTIETKSDVGTCEPIVEIPASPEPEQIQTPVFDIEDGFSEDPNEIPTIRLNMEEFTQTLQAYMQSNKELQGDMSKALVALATEAASIPTPKLKNVSRLRTEHHVYELPDTHQLLRGMDKREPDDPCPYLLAIWTPGETANSIEPPEKRCSSKEPGELCSDETCFYCNSQREANSQIVRGTLLIPCRTAMRGRFPLNGTYFQVNEVFADNDSSLNPIHVPRDWLWNLPRRTVYFGTSIPTIFKGLSTEGIQQCFWRGYVCVRGFDQKTRAPRPLMARLHFSAFKMSKARGKK